MTYAKICDSLYISQNYTGGIKLNKLNYKQLSPELQEIIVNDRKNHKENKFATQNSYALRRDMLHDKANIWREAFVRDTEKIMHLPLYNRYADKTQVFSLYNNDDITRRALHVQYVSRIARNICSVLGLNVDLAEAIALGHDLGHTPFGHAGERFLNELYHNKTGRFFNHNVHSVRILDKIFKRNLSFQTLDGILCHNGEIECQHYAPAYEKNFEILDTEINACYQTGDDAVKKLVPATLEGCVVRICDIIAYLGKDRQDAKIARIISDDTSFENDEIGVINAAIINNLTVDIIENSYGKDYISMSEAAFNDLKKAKADNSAIIYQNEEIVKIYENTIKPMFENLYERLLKDIKDKNENSEIYRHHIKFVYDNTKFYKTNNYQNEDPNDIVADYIASMTDDYFVALHKKLFPNSNLKVEYKSYFE